MYRNLKRQFATSSDATAKLQPDDQIVLDVYVQGNDLVTYLESQKPVRNLKTLKISYYASILQLRHMVQRKFCFIKTS